MRQSERELDALGVAVAVVTFQGGPVVEAYVRQTDLSWPILIDDSRSLYEAYGMRHGRWWNVWGPPSWGVYIKLLLQGRKLQKPTGDVHQLGGDVLIAPDGIVRLHHVGSGPADRPAVSSILELVRRESPSGEKGEER